jgi:hypothetical protein
MRQFLTLTQAATETMRQLTKMNTTSKNQIKLKDGRIYSTGENFNVVPSIDRPDYGALCFPLSGGAAFKIPYSRLPKLFTDFHSVTEEELEEAVMDCYCPSITGEDVEPDGHDSHGFPSWLIALGMC